MTTPNNNPHVNPHVNALERDGKRILIQTVIALIALIAGLAALSYFFKPQMEELSKLFIQKTGLWGVGLGFFLPDALTLPIPPDTFLVAGHLGGLKFWDMLIWASVGSVLGGTSGYLMIRALSRRPSVSAWLDPKLKTGREFMDRYGLIALALGALTPLPYSMICWACGAAGVRLVPFVLVSLLRIPRVALYLLLIEETLSHTGGASLLLNLGGLS
jgi:membrane protein YqaA with SNARE-associated domain